MNITWQYKHTISISNNPSIYQRGAITWIYKNVCPANITISNYARIKTSCIITGDILYRSIGGWIIDSRRGVINWYSSTRYYYIIS